MNHVDRELADKPAGDGDHRDLPFELRDSPGDGPQPGGKTLAPGEDRAEPAQAADENYPLELGWGQQLAELAA